MTFHFQAHCALHSLFESTEGQGGVFGREGCLTVGLVSSGRYSYFGGKSLFFAPPGSFILAGGPLGLSMIEAGHIAGVVLSGAAPRALADGLETPELINSAWAPAAAEALLMLTENPSLPQSEASAAAFTLLCRLAAAQAAEENLPHLVKAALAHISEHYAEVYGIEELAQSLGVTKSHLVRMFSEHMGVTPGRYLTGIRVDAAKRLLLYRDYSLEVVASLCGFSGANYLCKVFRRATGETPAAWRRAALEQTARPEPPPEEAPEDEMAEEWEDMLYL